MKSSVLTRSSGLLAGILAVAGFIHLIRPEVFEPAMPTYLSAHRELILLTGGLELTAAIGLCLSPLRRITGYSLVAYFIAILPAHVHVAWNGIPMFGISHPALLWGRTAFQSVFILWAWQIARRA